MLKYTWSYSSLSLFKMCPHKYYRLRVVKDIKDTPSHAMTYGLEAHKIAEEYVRDGVPIPATHEYLKPLLDKLIGIKGDKYCEHKMALTKELEPTTFMAKNVWWKGIADLLIVDGDKARIVDYKTGQLRYGDTKQLEILTLATFKHFPEVKEVKTGLLFVVDRGFISADFHRAGEEAYWQNWYKDLDQLEASYENNVWNPVKNFTCKKYCPVRDCAHNGNNR